MQHTYLRYECADAISLISSHPPLPPSGIRTIATLPRHATTTTTTTTSNNNNNLYILTTSGSQCSILDLKRDRGSRPHIKLSPIDHSSSIGSGKSLPPIESTCVATATRGRGTSVVVVVMAVGWMDGSIRLWEASPEDCARGGAGVVNTLSSSAEERWDEPLLLNGHDRTPVRCLTLSSTAHRLASGGADGSLVLWDLVNQSGLFRLLGHVGGIVFVEFLNEGMLVSGGLDGTMKVWDLEGQCCVQTVVEMMGGGGGGGVGCGGVVRLGGGRGWRVVAGGEGGFLRVWGEPSKDEGSDEMKKEEAPLPLSYKGSLARPTSERPTSLSIHPTLPLLALSTPQSKNIEIYAFRSSTLAEKKRKRRLRRRNQKLAKKESRPLPPKTKGLLDDDDPSSSDESSSDDEDADARLPPEMTKACDEMTLLGTIRATQKVRSTSFSPHLENDGTARLAIATSANSVECFSLTVTMEEEEKKKTKGVMRMEPKRVSVRDMYGHPTGIRSISLHPHDDHLLATISKGSLKLWNLPTRSAVRSLPLAAISDDATAPRSVYALVSSFLSTDLILLGTRDGHLLICDVGSGDVVFFEENAHDGSVWTLDVVTEDGVVTVVSGGADNAVIFWTVVSSADDDESSSPHPSLVRTRALTLSDDVLSVKISHDGEKRLVAVAGLDGTVKVFFYDTLKFFLSLYGHTLPVLCVDVSSDDALLVSGSADKTLKIWGLDFGDAHRTLRGHDDSVTDVTFVENTHYFFSCGKDKTVRYWDADKFEQILLLEGHFAEVNCLAVAKSGGFVVSGGMDRQVRVWERTKDLVFLEEERERELEREFDRQTVVDEGAMVPEEEEEEGTDRVVQSDAAVKRSLLSVKSGDRLMEAIEIADRELKDCESFAGDRSKKMKNPLLLGYDPAGYVLWILRSVKTAELEQSLLVLPLAHVERLVFYLVALLRRGVGVELCSRVAIVLIKNHQNAIIATHALSTPIRELRRLIKLRLSSYRNTVGFNLAAMRTMAKASEERRKAASGFFDEDGRNKAVDVWAGMGLGSDVASALERKKRRR